MARLTGAKCRVCRRLGAKLFLKGPRCFSNKCPMQKPRRGNPPGAHGGKRPRHTEYGLHQREVQRAKKTYGLTMRPFRRVFEVAQRMPGDTGDNLIVLLERRLDNVVLRLGFTPSRTHARQLIVHGHLRLNGKPVKSPSLLVRAGDVIEPAPRERSKKVVLAGIQMKISELALPSWLRVEPEVPRGTVVQIPKRQDLMPPFDALKVVEFMTI